MEEVITEEEQQGEEMSNAPLFPQLEELRLYNLPKLGHFFQTKRVLEFPFLKELKIRKCPEMKTFLQQGFVYCPSLEKLFINGANSITALCSHQLPTAYFSKLEILEVRSCEKLRNLMTPSVARGLLNLRTLSIKNCQMEEVITEEEPQGEEIMTNEPLFPRLEELIKLGHFILTKHALKFPFLRAVKIQDCPEMKTFIQQGSVSTPSLESVNNDDEVKVDDLNEWIHQRFNSKKMEANLKIQSSDGRS
ncbi:hypothetical protein P3S68_029340 [Capsicum galapagoense]